MFDIADSIKAVGEAFTSLFNYCQTNTEHQSETQIVKDKRRLKKATNVAQQIFAISDKYQQDYTLHDRKAYQRLRAKFDKED